MRFFLLAAGFLAIASCTDTHKKAQTGQENLPLEQESKVSNGDLMPGTYHVHQLSSAGFLFQYKLELKEDGEYKMFDKTGSYEYDPANNLIRFTSGGIKDFNGVFTRIPHLNESRNLMIVLDFQGGIPDTMNLGKKPGGYYQYAYYQQP